MTGRKIEAMVASPPEREKLVVQLFVQDEGQWGEVSQETDDLLLELYPKENGQPWVLDLHQVIHILQRAQERLAGSSG